MKMVFRLISALPIDHARRMMSSKANPSSLTEYLTTTSMALNSFVGKGSPCNHDNINTTDLLHSFT